MRDLALAVAAAVCMCPAFAHADEVHDALEAYALYQTDVSALLSANIEGARDVDAALTRLSRHDPDRVARGWIAYGALTAAQSPAFAEGVERDLRRNGRAPVLNNLRTDLYYARREPAGAAQAVQLILGAANADSARIDLAGDRYNRFAHSSGAPRARGGDGELERSVRLSPTMRQRLRVTAVSARPMSEIDDFGGRGFWDSLSGREATTARSRGGREERDYASVTDHMLTIAAIVVADATGSERRRIASLLSEPLTQQCMTMQRLQLRQCLSVSVDGSERAYCLAHHGLSGPGDCFANVVR
ncbi:hypothetical protein [Candidatus Viadribacter manganicus]|nr:hypothetical protein [Candidatus Viadribacter manganicus]